MDNFQWNKSDYIKLSIGPLQHAKVFSCFLSRVLALLIIVSMVGATDNKIRCRYVLGRIHRIGLTLGRDQLVQLPRLAAPCSCSQTDQLTIWAVIGALRFPGLLLLAT